MVGCLPKMQPDAVQSAQPRFVDELPRSDNRLVAQSENPSSINDFAAPQPSCDPSTLIQLKEQVQSLDILQEELIERNTQLSEELAQLKEFELKARSDMKTCDERVREAESRHQQVLERTRKTYEDLIADLRLQLADKEATIRSLGRPDSSPAPQKKPVPKP